ncbi:MAG: energy transducer TonB [Fibrobacter sp.]|nr:energy transducer TonB [Fibrobacter sp.]
MNFQVKTFKNVIIRSGLGVLRLILAIAGAVVLFALLPLSDSLFKQNYIPGITQKKSPVVLMKQIQKKEEPKQQTMQPIRSMTNKNGSSSSNTRNMGFSIRFAPDLGIESSGEGVSLTSSASSTDAVYDEGEIDEVPKLVKRTTIAYPRSALDAGIEGTVTLILLIGISGDVLDVKIESSPSQLFVKPVLQAIKQWKFIPGRNKGVPVKVRVRESITFNLES